MCDHIRCYTHTYTRTGYGCARARDAVSETGAAAGDELRAELDGSVIRVGVWRVACDLWGRAAL